MASTAPSGWSALKTTSSKPKNQKQCPKLFYNFSASPKNGLKLLLTDLISLWRCSLPRSKITSSASEKRTSIDPSESTEQMRIFVDKLALALHSGTNKLTKDDNEDTTLRPLVLNTTLELPKPLKPLEWTFILWPQAASELAATILRPTLHQLSMAQQKLKNMFDVVNEKDHVIERLLDRVAEKGVDMSLIFPTLTGTSKRGGSGVKVEEARKLVPGMKTFDRHAWERGFKEDEKDAKADVGLSELVQGCEKCFVHSEADHAESMSSWVNKLPGAESLEGGASKSFMGRSQSQSQSQRKGDEDTESENEFETQVTRPHLKKRASPEANDDDSSDNERRQPLAKRAKTGTAKLGALGRRSRSKSKTPAVQEQEKSSSPVPPTKAPSLLNRRNSDASTATETASESDDKPQPVASTQSPSKPSRLGGLNKSSTAAKSSQPQRSPTPRSRPPTADSNASTPSRRLGRIGNAGKRTTTASPIPDHVVNDDGSRGPGQQKLASQQATPSKKLGRLGMRNKKNDLMETSQAHNGKEESGSPPSTRTRDKSKVDLHYKQAKNAADHDESDATASPSPSPTPNHPYSKIQSPPSGVAPDDSNDKVVASRQSSSTDKSNQAKEMEQSKQPESEEQRAARRRQELKRTIQISGPKKKRRF